jgi:hypothetical protein
MSRISKKLAEHGYTDVKFCIPNAKDWNQLLQDKMYAQCHKTEQHTEQQRLYKPEQNAEIQFA